jgi:hypothetical protein
MLVKIDDTKSNKQIVEHGVPQGSILGPLLFSVMINDINLGLDSCNVLMYADDTTLYISGKNVEELKTKLQSDLNYINWWFGANKMKINMKKCKVMLFKKPRQASHNINLVLDGENIEQTNNFKLLGFHLDPALNWCNHLKHLRNKLKSQLFLINSIKNFLPLSCMRDLYYGLFHSHMIYGLSLWARSCNKKDLNYIKTQHKKALKLFPSDGVLDIESTIDLEFLKIGHKFRNECLPTSLMTFFDIAPNRGRDLRGRYNFHRNRFTLEVYRNSFINQVPLLWNDLNPDVVSLPYSRFVATLKRNFAVR